MVKTHVIDYLMGAEQKIPDWLIKLCFWENLKGKLGQVLNPGLVSRALAQGFFVTDFIHLT